MQNSISPLIVSIHVSIIISADTIYYSKENYVQHKM